MQRRYTALDFELSEAFVGLVLGMDTYLRRHHSDGLISASGESMLVPVNMTDVEPADVKDLDGANHRLEEIRSIYRTDSAIDPARKVYMARQIGAVILLSQWLQGRPFPFPDLVAGLLDIDPDPVPASEAQRLRVKLSQLLEKEGLTGELPQAVEQWRRQHRIPGESVGSTLEELIRTAQKKTIEAGFKAAKNLDVSVERVNNKRYSAYCDYFSKKILINGDLSYSFFDLKHLATHEAFPGHMLHMAIRYDRVQKRLIPSDAGLVITDTPSSPIFEGIAENGVTFLDWRESKNDDIHELYRSIRSVSCLNASYMLHHERRSVETVKKYLRSNALSDESWIESRIQFLTSKLFAPFIYGYWRGFEAVAAVIASVEKSRKSISLIHLLESMHCISSLHYATGLFPESADNGRMSGLN